MKKSTRNAGLEVRILEEKNVKTNVIPAGPDLHKTSGVRGRPLREGMMARSVSSSGAKSPYEQNHLCLFLYVIENYV